MPETQHFFIVLSCNKVHFTLHFVYSIFPLRFIHFSSIFYDRKKHKELPRTSITNHLLAHLKAHCSAHTAHTCVCQATQFN